MVTTSGRMSPIRISMSRSPAKARLLFTVCRNRD
jgi:hypothetical protein